MSDEAQPPPDDRDPPVVNPDGSDRAPPANPSPANPGGAPGSPGNNPAGANPATPVDPTHAGGIPGSPPRRNRNGSAELPPLPPLPAGLLIPDDLSELDEEVRTYRKEWRTAHPPGWQRVLWPSWLRRQGHNLPLLLLALLSVAVFATLVSVPAPTRPNLPPQVALAQPTATPGSVGGLLPQVPLHSGQAQALSRDLRPALLVLLPPHYVNAAGSRETVSQVAAQAEEFQLATFFIAGPGDAGSAEALAETARQRGVVTALEDRTGVLARTYHSGPDPLLLAVAADGRLSRAPFPFHQGDRIEPVLDAISPLQPS